MQNNKSHGKTHFLKYVSSCTAIKILDRLKVRWSSPLLFNDPFDPIRHIWFPFDPAKPERIQISEEKEIIVKPLTPHQSEGFNQVWKQLLKRCRVFCVSEDDNNLLMWAHYGDSHKGVLIGFNCLPDRNTNSNLGLCDAKQIEYSKVVPTVGTKMGWIKHIKGANQLKGEDIAKKYLYTKSPVWQYEKEWPRWKINEDEKEQLYNDFDIDPKEIDSVCFGCEIEQEKRKVILNLIRERLKHVKVFDAIKRKDKFELNYEQIM